MLNLSQLKMASICYDCGFYDSDLDEGLCPQCLAQQEIEDGSRDDADDDYDDVDNYDPNYPLM